MLLRSSSTPVLGSLLPSSDSPNTFDSNKSYSCSENHNKISFPRGGHSSFHPYSSNSSPFSHSFVGISELERESSSSPSGFRRTRSDGNLEGLAVEMDDFHYSHPSRTSRRPTPVLQTIPSFSVYNSRFKDVDEEEEEEEGEAEVGEGNGLERSVTIGESILSIGGIDTKEREDSTFDNGIEAPPLFLAKGLGIDVVYPSSGLSGGGGCGGRGGGGSYLPLVDCNGGGEGSDVEIYYRKMVQENPCNPLFLSNYAQFLYQKKGDIERAEEYYARAILAGPGDGEILSQYAKLIWEHHREQERASSYFEQAVQAAPEDSHILGAYANFLWETEDDEGEVKRESKSQDFIGSGIVNGAMASASA